MTERAAAFAAHDWGYQHPTRSAWAVRRLNLEVAAGERVLLLGPSGAGKSTLLQGLAGVLEGEEAGTVEGTLTVDSTPPVRARGRVGYVAQDPETQLIMARCGDDVAFGLENIGVPTEQIWPRVREAMGIVEFPYPLDHPVQQLSGGEKQRLVLAGVLALRPGLLLLDEPTANLDPDGARTIRYAVQNAAAATGATLLLVEHRLEMWHDLVGRVVALEPGGGVGADGTPESVFAADPATLAARGIWVPGYRPTLPTTRPATPTPTRTPADGTEADAPSRTQLVGRELRLRYPDATDEAIAVARIELRSAEALAIRGRNGSGKSTLAMLLAGLLKPTTGNVTVPGYTRPLHRWPGRALVEQVGTVFQDPEHQFLTRSVRAELALGPRLAGLDAREVDRRTTELLERLRLDGVADANPFTLSGGEKRRLSVATALATRPQTLILDEPTFGQDPQTWWELADLLGHLRAEGYGMCCVSHDPDFVAALADRELWLEAGHPTTAPTTTRETGTKP